jgi:putative protease
MEVNLPLESGTEIDYPENDAVRRRLMTKGERIGEVTHFFGKINVAVLNLSNDLKLGDSVHFLGRNTDFEQEISSMQVDHVEVTEVSAGDDVAVKVTQRVRRGDSVFRITPEA